MWEISEIIEQTLISRAPYLQDQISVYNRTFDFPYRFILTYILIYLLTYVLTYLRTYLLTYLHSYLLTPWIRVLLEKLTVPS